MIYSVILPFFMGAFGVLQNSLLKRQANSVGLPLGLLVNNLVLLTCSCLLLLLLQFIANESLPDIFRPRQGWAAVGVRHLLPGILGFLIISLLPLAIERVGAMRVFVVVVAAQVAVSALWDFYLEAIPVSGWRIAGGALTLLGAAMAAF
jgi:uncharacterized membrane protein YdcZ (DUF606 family)